MTDRQGSSNGRLCASAALLLLSLLSCNSDPVASRDEFLGRGQQYLEVERYQEAAIELQNALQITPTHVPALFSLAQAYGQLGENQRAIALLQEVRELDATHVESRLELGKHLLRGASGNEDYYTQALELAEEILGLDPSHVEAKILRGNAYAGLGDLEQSLAQLGDVLEQDPDNLTAYINMGVFRHQLRDPQNAEKSFLEAARRHPRSGTALRSLANFYAATGDRQQAETNYRKALELEQDDTNLHSLIRFYLTTQNAERAEQTLQEIISSSGNAREAGWLLANIYLATGRAESGLARLQASSEEDPSDLRSRLRLAEVLLDLKRTDEARTVIESLPEREAAKAQTFYLRGRLMLAGGKREEALDVFTRATRLEPRFISAHMQKASLHMTRGEFPDAQQTLATVLRLNRAHIGAAAALAKVMALTGRFQDALRAADEILKIHPTSIDALVARGEALFRLRRFEESGRDYLRLVELRPEVGFYRQRLGTLEAATGNRTAALEHLSKTLEIDPDRTVVMDQIVYLLGTSGRLEEALARIDSFMDKSSRKEHGHVLRGKIHMVGKEYVQAEEEFRKAIQINQDYYVAYTLLVQLQVNQNRMEKAVAEVDQLLARNDRVVPALLMKALLLSALGDESGAIEYYRNTLELHPENPIASNNLAWIYGENHRNLGEAVSLARTARKKDPNNTSFADTLGWTYYKMGNYTLSVEHLLFAVNNGQPGAGNYYRLGMAYYRKGDRLLARQALRTAIQMDDSFPEVGEASSILAQLEREGE